MVWQVKTQKASLVCFTINNQTESFFACLFVWGKVALDHEVDTHTKKVVSTTASCLRHVARSVACCISLGLASAPAKLYSIGSNL